MCGEMRRWTWALRLLLLTLISLSGLIGIVGSGGGLMSDCPSGVECGPPPPQPSADVQPAYVTALVGTPVTFSAETTNVTGAITYQWSRSSDGGATYVDIVGATGSTYLLAVANLADDRAFFKVVVQGSGGPLQAVGHLAVSATPGLIFEDGEFQSKDWLVTPFANASAPAPAHTDERVTTGGDPGAYLKMVYTLPQQTGAARVFYTSVVAGYDPQAQGAIYVVDYSEVGIALQENTTTYTESAMLLEQGGRRYVANLRPASDYLPTHWSAIESRSSLLAQDFNLVDGPACQSGVACPDFSALGLPMRFGFWRISFGYPDDTIAHGIDNWKVTVWRR